MRTRKVGRRRLSSTTGISGSGIAAYRSGNNLPRHETAIRLAEALDWPILVYISKEARTAHCAVCGAEFLVASSVKLYCSTECNRVAEKRKAGGPPAKTLAEPLRRRLRDTMTTVGNYCRGCEPEGLCRDTSCALRPVSPLPMANTTLDSPIATPAPGRWARPEAREQHSAVMRDRWAALSAGTRVQRLEALSVARSASSER